MQLLQIHNNTRENTVMKNNMHTEFFFFFLILPVFTAINSYFALLSSCLVESKITVTARLGGNDPWVSRTRLLSLPDDLGKNCLWSASFKPNCSQVQDEIP